MSDKELLEIAEVKRLIGRWLVIEGPLSGTLIVKPVPTIIEAAVYVGCPIGIVSDHATQSEAEAARDRLSRTFS